MTNRDSSSSCSLPRQIHPRNRLHHLCLLIVPCRCPRRNPSYAVIRHHRLLTPSFTAICPHYSVCFLVVLTSLPHSVVIASSLRYVIRYCLNAMRCCPQRSIASS